MDEPKRTDRTTKIHPKVKGKEGVTGEDYDFNLGGLIEVTFTNILSILI